MADITFKEESIHTIGSLPLVGSKAPDFTVTKMDLSDIKLKNYAGQKILLNIFPSLDTSTCAAAMQRFNEIAMQFPQVLILCISADLPFAQQRFCTAHHLKNIQPASIFRHTHFGLDYGVRITGGALTGLLARAVIIINEEGHVIYTQQVPELTEEPNYLSIINVLKEQPHS